MLFEMQRACPRPGQSRVIASGPSAIKTLERPTTLLPNAKVSVETLTSPTETKKDEVGSMPDLRGPVPELDAPKIRGEEHHNEDERDGPEHPRPPPPAQGVGQVIDALLEVVVCS